MKLPIAYVILFLGANILSAQQDEKAISGLWLNHDGTSVIEIYEQKDKYYGRIHKILHFPENRTNGYSEEQLIKGKERMKGRLILKDLDYVKGSWVNGKILDPKDQSTKANCSITLVDDNQSISLKIKKGFFSTTKTWTKYESH